MTPDLVKQAAERIRHHVRETPVIRARTPGMTRAAVLKLEMMQYAGSFKVRGVFNKVLSSPVPPAGLIAASGGNHGLAVAYVAGELGLRAEIFVPALISAAKLERLRASGAAVTVAGQEYADALAASGERANATGAMVVHAYDEEAVVAGQGTTFWEFENQVQDLDTVLVAVGGGGLIGGAAAWLGGRVRLIGVETFGTATLHTALAAGEQVPVAVSGLAADSLGARVVGRIALSLAQRHVDQVVLVSDDDVVRAMAWLWDELRMVTEPGGATAVAALLGGGYRPNADERVGVLICGANADPAGFANLTRSA